MQIEVTEFVRPNGQQVRRDVYLEDVHQEQYKSIVDAGCRITVEITSNQDFFVCIEDSNVEADYVTNIFHKFSAATLIDGLTQTITSFDVEQHAQWQEVERRINGEEPPF